jgi:DNA-binding SARP family transcriptional activator
VPADQESGPMTKPTHYQILGPLEIRAGDRLLEVGGYKQRSVLAILLIHANEVVSADRLIMELWGERAPGGAHNTVQSYVSRLRKVLGDEGILQTRHPGYRLVVETAWVDSMLFESLVVEARHALRNRNPALASALLKDALALWGGNALADFRDETFAQAEIIRLEELRLGALEMKFGAELELGRHVESVADLEGLVRMHPLRERLWEHLILALYRSGRQADALDSFAKAQRLLAEELGLEPGPELKRLQERILNHDASLEVATVGGHRSEDAGRRHNLPLLLTSFVGRAHELDELKSHLMQSRLVTLTGVGGAGKSRLALRAGGEVLTDHSDGVWLVKLEGIDVDGEVSRQVAKVFGIPDQPDRALIDVLTTALGTRRTLLILDG